MNHYLYEPCNRKKYFEYSAHAEQTVMVRSSVYWCKLCKIPIYDEICSICRQKGKYLTTDIRPVYPAERLLLEIIKGGKQKCLSPAKKYKVYKSSINKSLHFAQRRLSSSTRG